MFSLKRFLQLTAVAAVSVFMVACAGGDKSTPSKGNMIPDNAVVALKVDFDLLLNKALGDENSPLRDYWNMAKSGLSGQMRGYGEVGEYVRKIINDPALSGIEVDEPVVVSCAYDMQNIPYVDPSVDVYMVALLEDRSAFIKVVDAVMNYAILEEDMNVSKVELGSYTYYEFLSEYDTAVDLGVAAKAAVLRIRENGYESGDALKESFVNLFANGGPEKSKGLKKFYGTEEEVALWVDLEGAMNSAMPLFVEELDPMTLSKIHASKEVYKGASVVADLAFNDGQTVVNCNVYGSDLLKETATKYNKPASDKYLKKVPASAALVLNLAIKDLDVLFDQLCAESRDIQDMYNDLAMEFGFNKNLLKGLTGTITLALDGRTLSYRSEPGLMLCVEAERNVWTYAQSYLDEFAERQSADKYSVDDQIYFLYEDDHMTMVDAKTMYTTPVAGTNSFADTEFGAQIKNSGLYLNLAAIPSNDLVKFFRREFDLRLSREQILGFCSSVVLTTSDDFMSTTLTLNMNDKEHNLLEKIALEAVPTF